uniref:Uncharacterized protein n=1 Tax=Amphimedon queenslandica TaxID=400682 RepID=A0A1X7UG42_AMPQE
MAIRGPKPFHIPLKPRPLKVCQGELPTSELSLETTVSKG